MPSLFLIFNHQFTPDQEADARRTLEVTRFIPLPEELQEQWSNVPPDFTALTDYLKPLHDWISVQAQAGDFVLIQGDFGACCLMVNFALENSLVPVYSTTKREAEEEYGQDGSIKLTHRFEHRIFRKYGR